MKKIAIVIPAYNEEKRIGPTLEAYGSFFDKLELQRKFTDNNLTEYKT